MLISGGYGRRGVTVSYAGKHQLRIAFSSSLVLAAQLDGNRVIMDWQPIDNQLIFIFTADGVYHGYSTFSLHPDGGTSVNSRAVHVNRKPFSFLQPGKYEATIGTDADGHTTITITLPAQGEAHAQ